MSGPRGDGPRFDLPEPDAVTLPYWQAAAEGRLLLKRCGDCGAAHHYPREFCPRCWSENVHWEQAGGRATLYTWSVVHRNDLPPFGARVPYVACVVDLAEGPRMMSELVGHADEDLRVGAELMVEFRHLIAAAEAGATAEAGEAAEAGGAAEGSAAGRVVPVFRPVGRASG